MDLLRQPNYTPGGIAMSYSIGAHRGAQANHTTGTAGSQAANPYSLDLTQPLHDQSGTGKKRVQPWAQHRANADLLAFVYEEIGNDPKASRLRGCSPRLLFERRKAENGQLLPPNAPGALKLKTAWFCRVRLCPMCQWRRSLKIYGQTIQIVRAAQQQRKGVEWIHLTLTVKNCDGIFLGSEITHLLAGWNRLTKQKRYKDAVLGAMRSLEVTHNLDLTSDSYDTFHPHLHVMLAVPPSYWHKKYIKRDTWAEMWRQAMRLDYTPEVWVKRFEGDNPAALAELTKYATKPDGYIVPDDLDMMQASIKCLDNALHRRRLIAWHGWLKELHAQLGLDDAENGDLVQTDNEQETAEDGPIIAYGYAPAQRNYFAERSRPHEEAAKKRAGAGAPARPNHR